MSDRRHLRLVQPECDHQWGDPVQPLVDSHGYRKFECWRCGKHQSVQPTESNAITEGPMAFPGTHELPEFGELPSSERHSGEGK